MDSELFNLLNDIKEKTRIDVGVFSESKKYFATTKESFRSVTLPSVNFDGVILNKESNKTFFKVKHKNAKLIGVIDGADDTSKNYAYLITGVLENSNNKEIQLSQKEYLKVIVLGECNRAQIQNYISKFGVPNAPCFALVVNSKDCKSSAILNLLDNFTTNSNDNAISIDENTSVFIKFADSVSGEYQSPVEYAQFLHLSIYEELGAKVKVAVGSTVNGLHDISASYQQAMTAMRMAVALNSKGEVHSFNEYILVKMLEDIPKFKLNEYLEMLLDGEAKTIFGDEDMINTAEEFLENSLNVSETSRNLYLHRNTLMYRLDKIEHATGLNIRKFSDAVIFRLITILYKLIK